MIRTSSLTFAYPGQPPVSFPDVSCEKNEHALILGPSGTGKTTLLHLLGGILSPASGQIMIGDTPLHSLRGQKLDSFRGQHIGIIFQKPHFIRSLTALENLLLAQSLSGNKSEKSRALSLMERLAIGRNAYKKTTAMSIGEQQRLAIARALINNPAIILADEPSSALDDQNCRQMIDLLLEVATENKANLIVVTHDSRIKDSIDKKIYLD
ncbi:MAG: ATP-binding cassette domain-containing protein [Saprospiraceae bacterium]|nr:ATP-binding cassette domain-containing protein [Candidatus Opimibacter iunctus]